MILNSTYVYTETFVLWIQLKHKAFPKPSFSLVLVRYQYITVVLSDCLLWRWLLELLLWGRQHMYTGASLTDFFPLFN